MDDGGHDNRGHRMDYFKGVHPQWNMISQYQVKEQNMMNRKIMHIAAERDAAVAERDRALAEKKAALDERDIALQQRDTAMSERDIAIRERDNAIAALHFHENTMNNNVWGCTNGRGTKRTHHHHIHPNQHIIDVAPISVIEAAKLKRTKENPTSSPNQNKSKNKNKSAASSKPLRSKGKKVGEDLNRQVTTDGSKAEWDAAQDLGLMSQINFDESTMPIPICSCTGLPRQCYKWGNGGWQSSCCTTTLSVYPLPQLPNKRHSRMGGRKMSGSVFSRLLSRLAAQGQDLSIPLDLKNYWAKHGTNRYITIK